MNSEWTIEITDTITGRQITARVKLLVIGIKVATQIECRPVPTPEELETISAAVRELIERETGRNATCKVREVHPDKAKAQVRIRELLGGGQG